MFVCHLVFLSRCMEPEGLWQRLVAAPRDRQHFPPVYPSPTPGLRMRRHSGGITTSPSPHIRQKKHYLNKGKKQRKGKFFRNVVWSPPSLLFRPLGGGFDLHLDLRVHLFSRLLLGGRGLVLGCLGRLGSLLPTRAGGGISAPTLVGGPPSWRRRRRPAPRAGPCSWHTG